MSSKCTSIVTCGTFMSAPGLRLSFSLAEADTGFNTGRKRGKMSQT